MNTGHLVSSYGYWAVFTLVAIESLGIPLPGETALIAAGAYAGTTHRLSPWLIFIVAAAAAIIGDNIGYWIGDRGGYALAVKYGPKVRLDQRKLKVARYLFDRHGGKVVFFGRFVSILRTYAAFLAGTSLMQWRKFLLANGTGGVVWAGVYTVAAYYAGASLQRASGKVTLILGVLAVIVIVLALITVRHQINRLSDRAEAAYPGPLTAHRRKSGGGRGSPAVHAVPHGDDSASESGAGNGQGVSAQPHRPVSGPVSRAGAEVPGDPGSGQRTTSPRPGQRG